MPETYLDSTLQTGFDDGSLLALKLETTERFKKVLEDNINQPEVQKPQPDPGDIEVNDIINGRYSNVDLNQAAISSNPKIRDAANYMIDKRMAADPVAKGVGATRFYPYEKAMDKYLYGDFGYNIGASVEEEEDFYYRNQYMSDGAVWRTTKNFARFISRVVPSALLKFGQGVGYIGSMLTSIGSDNYWADVADNAFSNFLTETEDKMKNSQLLNVYKKAGFDEQGFFSKLTDATFWNESVADGVAFMVSAMIPAAGIGRLGKIGALAGEVNAFARPFATTNVLGRIAQGVGLGSPAQITTWTLNTAMESAQEGAGVFKTSMEAMKKARLEGDPVYANMSDEQMRLRAGELAKNTILQNFAVLGISNAWENKLFHRALGQGVGGRPKVDLSDEFRVVSQDLDDLAKKGLQPLNPLSRTGFYGRKAIEGTFVEGFWEENAQLAIERINTGEAQYDNIAKQMLKQTWDASWFGKGDTVAAESIGLGALIGVGAGTILSKIGNERKSKINEIKNAIEKGEKAYQRLFNINDIYERDKDDKIVFDENNKPKIDPLKEGRRAAAVQQLATQLSQFNPNTTPNEFLGKRAFSNFVRSLSNIGIENISQRFRSLTPETAALFGQNPSVPNENAKDLADLADKFEEVSKTADKAKRGTRPESMTVADFNEHEKVRKAKVYRHLADNTIISKFSADETSKLLKIIADTRNISNSTISDSVIDNINMLQQQLLKNRKLIDSEFFENFSVEEKKYHLQREKELKKEIETLKKNNQFLLQDARISDIGFYFAQIDGKEVIVPKELGETSSKIAEYNNIMHKNNYVANLFLNSFEDYLKWQEGKQNITEEQESKPEENLSKKYREFVKGDFDKVTKLVAKMVFGSNQQYSNEERELQENYSELIAEILPQYENAVENQRVKVLLSKIETLKSSAQKLETLIGEQTILADDAVTEIEILIDDLNHISNQGRSKQKDLKQQITGLEEKIAKFEEWIEPQKAKLEQLNSEIELLDQEIKGGSYRGLEGALQELKQERDWVDKEIIKTVSLIDRLAKLIRQIRKLAYDLFGSKDSFDTNLKKGRWEAVESQQEITDINQRLKDAKKYAEELQALQKELQDKYTADQAFLNSLLDEVDNYYKKQYLDLTEAKPQPIDVEDEAIMNGFFSDKESFPPGDDSGAMPPDDNAGFDGSTYQRPLSTKFFTTTFPYIVRSEKPTEEEEELLSQNRAFYWNQIPNSVKDYFEFVNFLTDPVNTKDIKNKVGNGTLKAIVVTRNNVEALGLSKLLDKDEYFALKKAEETHFEVIPVLESPEGTFYLDSKLNKLGKVGEEPSSKLVRTSLRKAYFTEKELDQYSNEEKYGKDAAKKALKIATDWRKAMLEKTEQESIVKFEFNITRGIPNKMIMQDGTQSKNPVEGIILPEIKHDSVVIFSNVSKTQSVNGEPITFPVGRPFIKVDNKLPYSKGGHVQYHAADNSKLSENQVETITTVLEHMFKDHMSRVMNKINNDKDFANWKTKIEKAGGIHLLDRFNKKRLFLEITKASQKTGYKLFNPDYTVFLSSILHFGNRTQDKKTFGQNQLHFIGVNLVFGTSGISIDMTTGEGLRSSRVKNFLSSQFHNIKYFTKEETQKREFTEYYVKDGKLETRVWDNYSQYLLSEKTPEGEKRDVIPVTTSIKKKEQHDIENTDEPYYTYRSRGITLISSQVEKVKKRSKVDELNERIKAKKGNQTEEEEEEEEKSGKPKTAVDKLNARAKAKFKAKAEAEAKSKQKEEEEQAVEGEVIEYTDEGAIKYKPEEPEESSSGEPDTDEGPNLAGEAFRISKGGLFKTEKDLDSIIQKVSKMIPQFPIVRLKKAIQTLDGREAWGQFINNVIEVFEGAEEGTLFHEAFEAVSNRILSDQEWKALSKEFKSRQGYFTDRESERRVKYSDATEQEIKEALAEEFRLYMLTGQIPAVQPQKRSYFRIILDFIKSFFINRTTIEQVFKNIEEGKYADSGLRATNRFGRNYSIRMKGIPVETVRELLESATAEMFRIVFSKPDSLSSLDEIDFTDESLYEPIKSAFESKVTTLQKSAEVATDEKLKDKYLKAAFYIQSTLDKWGEFVSIHKDNIRRFKIKFEEEETEDVDELNNTTNRNDYTSDHFKTDGKNAASKSVKFLFGTLLKLRFDRKGKTSIINGNIVGKIEPVQSSIFSLGLAGYDEYMFKALDSFQGLNDWTRIKEKIEDLAGFNKIRQFQGNEEGISNLVASMSRDEATWTSLYTRVFGHYPDISPDAQWQLKVKLHNYVSKFAPTSWITFDGGSSSYLLDAVNRPYYENIRRKITQGIIKNYNKFLEKNSKLGAIVARKAYSNEEVFESFTKRTKKEIEDNKLPSKVVEMITFMNLTKELSPEVIFALNEDEKNKVYIDLLNIRNSIPKMKVYGKKFTPQTLDIEGFTKNLISRLDKINSVSQKGSQIRGLNNEMRQVYVVPSFISRIFSEINNVSNIRELYERYPHLEKIFSRDSIILSRLFDKDGDRITDYNISLDYIAGLKEGEEKKGTSTSQLEFHDRYFQQFNSSLVGLHMSLPADSEIEWAFNFGQNFVDFENNLLAKNGSRIIEKNFLPKLKTEIDLIRTNSSRLAQLNQKYPDNTKETGANSNVGTSLRFFKTMLLTNKGEIDTKLLNKIYDEIDNGKNAEVIIKTYKNEIVKAIKNYISREVESARKVFIDNRLAVPSEEGYLIRGLNFDFIEKNRQYFKTEEEESSNFLNEDLFTSLLEYQKINSILAGMESFKLFFGDPAQYKDWEKRAKSLFSPYEQVFYDKTGEFNNYLNSNKNLVKFENDVYNLSQDDMFYTIFNNTFNSRTINDFTTIDVNLVNDLKRLKSSFADNFLEGYEEIDETDGQSIGTLEFARQLMIKSGWRWTKELEAYYQYDTALMRKDMSEKGEYQYKDNLKEIDEKIIEYYKNNPEGRALISKAKLTPIKTLMPSIDQDGDHILEKHSIHFMSYQMAKEFEMYDLYKSMLRNKESLLNFKSAEKVGNKLDKNNKVTDYYKTPFEKNDIRSEAIGNPLRIIDFRTIGIQVETQTSEWGQTLGSQLTKLIYLGLSEQGVPVDFQPDTKSISERIESWEALSEEEKITNSPVYEKIVNVRESLSNLKVKNTIEKFSKIGVKWNYSPINGFTYEIDDLSKIKEYIHEELRRLDVDSNTIDNIELTEDRRAFENPAETTPSFETISNLLWSMADKAITSMKVNGKPLVQISSAFFNKGTRTAAYKDDNGMWVELKTKEEYDKFIAENNKKPEKERKKVALTSSELKFYSLSENGPINAMEIYLPNIFIDKVNKKREKRGLAPLSEEELLKYLDKPENAKLLEGIGFRIPTQATSSIEFFKVKGFLPAIMGSSVVVPSAITRKGGSDFDVDKLNTYLNNWKLKNGYPVYEDFDTDMSQRGLMRRYVDFVRKNSRPDDMDYIRALSKTEKSEIYKDFEKLRDDILKDIYDKKDQFLDENYKTFLESVKDIKNFTEQEKDSAMKTFFSMGKRMFRNLSDSTRSIFFDLKDRMEITGESGAEEIFQYLLLAERLLPSVDKTDRNILSSMIRIYNHELDLFQTSREKRQEYINQAKARLSEDNKSVRDYYKQQKIDAINNENLDEERDEALFNLNFEQSVEIANLGGLISFEDFSRLPIALQNSKGAVENNYFQSIRNILSSRELFTQLLSPNSADNIKKMRDEVYKAIDPEWKPADKKSVDFAKLTSTEWIAEKRNQFVKGKRDIGIGAVAMTNYANSGVTGIGIAIQGKVRDKLARRIIYDMNEGRVDVPFEDVEMMKIEDKYVIPLSKLRDKEGNLTMDKLSGYINGFVDVAKDPFIAEMGMHAEFAGVYLLMERMGMRGKTIALFMYNPVVRDYLKKIIMMDSKSYYGFNNGLDSRSKIIDQLESDYKPDNFVYPDDYILTDEKLASMLKGEKVSKFDQYMVLINFLKLKTYSDHLLEDIQTANHDTSKVRSFEAIQMKDLKLNRAKKGNLIVKIEKGKIINAGEVLRRDTTVSTDIDLLNTFGQLYRDINLFALQKPNPKKALDNIAEKIYNENPYMTQDDFLDAMKQYKASLIDVLVNDTEIPVYNETTKAWENVKMYRYYKNFFKTGMKNSNGVPITIKATFENLKRMYPNTFKGNFFLSNLIIESDPVLGIDTMRLEKTVMNNEVLLKERLIEALIQLSNYSPDNYPENFKEFAINMNKLYRMILYGAYMQYGIKFSLNSFVNILPVKSNKTQDDNEASISLTDLTKFGLSKIDNYDFSNLFGLIQRSKSYRKNMVQEKMQNAVNMLVPSTTQPGKFVLESQPRWKGGKRKKKGEKTPAKKTNQTFFGRVVTFTGEDGKSYREVVADINPVMIWAGYEGEETSWEDSPERIKIPIIKPEYLQYISRLNEEGYPDSWWDVKPEVYEMIKKGDHSYTYDLLLQKVGIEDVSLARKLYTKSKKKGSKTSVNYLYKPINKQGDPLFNEFKPLLKDGDGNTYLTKSIIEGPEFRELTDAEIVNNIINHPDTLIPVFEPEMPTEIKGAIMPKPGQPLPKSNIIPSMIFDASAILSIRSGEKTMSVKTETQAKSVNIPDGATELRKIGGDTYTVTNRGYLTIEEAGGIDAVLQAQGVTAKEAINYKSSKEWIEGKRRLYVYDIKRANTIDPGDKPPVDSPC